MRTVAALLYAHMFWQHRLVYVCYATKQHLTCVQLGEAGATKTIIIVNILHSIFQIACDLLLIQSGVNVSKIYGIYSLRIHESVFRPPPPPMFGLANV